jgi:YD repeat-containing protein
VYVPIGWLVAGSVGFAYDSDFRVSAVSLNCSDPVSYQYDSDGPLTQTGSLTLSRSAANGMLTGTTLGVVTDALSYNGFGEAASYEATVNGASLFRTDYAYDKLGRIVGKTEILGSTVSSYTYGYDEAGRLQRSIYAYDEMGNFRRVTLTDGRVIDYVIDAANRRIGKKVDGALVQSFLYQDRLKPVA